MKLLASLCWCLPLLAPSTADLGASLVQPCHALPSTRQVPHKCRLFGKIQVVESFPDVKVQLVSSFPDIKVQVVSSFADKPGKWRFVDSFPDFKVQFVDSFPDYKVEYVDSFPGCK